MRYYIDTNISAFMRTGRTDELSGDVADVVEDYTNTLLVSAVCVQELIHLVQIGKIGSAQKKHISANELLRWLRDMCFVIVPVSELHLQTMSELPLYADHRDPSDRLIIAQAISDRIPLVSSDLKFSRYTRHGLDFVYNKR